MRKERFGGAAVAAVALAVVLAIPQSRSATVVAAPADPPRVQVELGALERAATPLPVAPIPAAPAPGAPTSQVPAPPAPAPRQVLLDGGIPVRVLAAYHRAADLMAAADPGCRLDWALLAGIGRIESGHAAGGRVDAAGTTRGRILGPVLDGSLPGSILVADTDGGTLDGDTRFDRATGPMQFLPATWRSVGADADADGVADPNNVDDAALGAARYLCAGGGDLSTGAGATGALFRYNRSATYGATVLGWAQAYRTGATAVPDQDGPVPAGDPGPQVLAAAEGTPDAPRPAAVPDAPAPFLGPVSPPPPPSGGPARPAEKPPAPPTTAPSTDPGTKAPPTPPPPTTLLTTPPVTIPPVSTPPVTTSPVTTSPVTTPPVTTSPVTTPPVTTSPVTTPPVTTSPVPPAPACPAATVAASTARVLPDAAGLLLRFALPPLPAGCRVAAATLLLDPGAAAASLTVRRPTAGWSATTVAEPASVGPDVVSAPAAGPRRLTVTALVTALYAGPDHGLLVRGVEAPTGRVRLTVTFGSG